MSNKFKIGDKVRMELGTKIGTVVGFGVPDQPQASKEHWVIVRWPTEPRNWPFDKNAPRFWEASEYAEYVVKVSKGGKRKTRRRRRHLGI